MNPKAPLSTEQYAAAATASNTKLAYQKDLNRFAAWAPQAEGTLLSYAVNAHVGGKLAQIGSRLVDGTAKKMAAAFFARFEAQFRPDDAR